MRRLDVVQSFRRWSSDGHAWRWEKRKTLHRERSDSSVIHRLVRRQLSETFIFYARTSVRSVARLAYGLKNICGGIDASGMTVYARPGSNLFLTCCQRVSYKDITAFLVVRDQR